MNLYHATSKDKADMILKDGKIDSIYGLGYVYLTDDIQIAKTFGEIVFVIKKESLNPDKLSTHKEWLCDILKTTDFYNYAGDIKVNAKMLLQS